MTPDLQIYHDGSNAQLVNSTGALFTQGTVKHMAANGSDYMATFNSGGSVELYHNTSVKLATTSTGIDVTGEVQADSLDIDGLSVLTSNNNATPLTLERASATSDQVGIQFSAGNSRYFGKGTDDEPYWATSANLTAGSKIVTAGNFTGILDSTYYQSGDNISVGTIVVSGTVDGVDIAARDAVLTSTTTTAGAALPKAGGTLTGDLNINYAGNAKATIQALYFGTTGNHYNWRIAAQELVNAGFEIAVGSQDTDYSNDTYVNKFVVKASGNVGIGTDSPDRQLEISTTTAGLLTSSANRQGSVIKLTHNINHEAGYTGGDFLGGIEFESGDGSAGGGVRAAIRAEATNPYNTHSLKFYTATSNSTSIASRMTIDHNGNVGIGTSTPQKKFHVEHTAGASEGILISGASDTVGHTAGILLRAEGGEADSALRAKAGIFLERTATYGIGKLHIANRHNSDNVSATTSDANITIYDDKVGIGTTSPSKNFMPVLLEKFMSLLLKI